MKRKIIEITIIGSGHYAIDLISKEYTRNNNCVIKAVIANSYDKNKVENSPLKNVPFFKDLTEWKTKFGKADSNDLFDLCVHENSVLDIVKELVKTGAKNIILPKPLPLAKKSIDQLLTIQKEKNTNMFVASQWHYCDILDKTRLILNKLKKDNKLKKVTVDFSQTFSEEHLRKYSVVTALLPHMIQVLSKIGLDEFKITRNIEVNNSSSTNLEIKYKIDKPYPFEIKLMTDLKSKEKRRNLYAYDENGNILLSLTFSGNNMHKYPILYYNKRYFEAREHDLTKMVKEEIKSLIDNNKNKKVNKIMNLEDYLDIQKMLITINGKIQK